MANAGDDEAPNYTQHPFTAIEASILGVVILVATLVLVVIDRGRDKVNLPEYPIWEATRV